MSEKIYTESDIDNALNIGKRVSLIKIEERVKSLSGHTIGDIELISRKSVLKDIEILRLEIGIESLQEK